MIVTNLLHAVVKEICRGGVNSEGAKDRFEGGERVDMVPVALKKISIEELIIFLRKL